MPTNMAPLVGMIILAWCVPVQPVADASQAGGEPCPDIAGCPLPGSCAGCRAECLRIVEQYTARGSTLGDMSCYIRAANALQDEKLLGRPHALPEQERLIMYRLYVAAAGTLLSRPGSDSMADARGWLLRAAQIVSPSVEVLFREEPPPRPASPTPGANVREGDWDAEAAAAGLWAQIGTRQLRAGATLYSAGSVEDGLRCVRMAVRLLMQGANRGEDSQEGWTALMTLGEMLQGQGRDAEAIPWLAWAVRVLRVEGYAEQGRGESWRERVSSALGKLTRAACSAAYRLRDAHGDAAGALALLQRAQARDLMPSDTTLALLPHAAADAAVRLALDTCAAARLVRQLDAALAACTRALRLLGRETGAGGGGGEGAGHGGALLQEPAGAEEGKEQGSAWRSVQEDVKAVSAAHFNTGVTLFDLADWPAAVTHLRHARALQPEALDARLFLALALMRWGLAEGRHGRGAGAGAEVEAEAARVLMDAATLSPAEPNVYVTAAMFLVRTGAYDAAREVRVCRPVQAVWRCWQGVCACVRVWCGDGRHDDLVFGVFDARHVQCVVYCLSR